MYYKQKQSKASKIIRIYFFIATIVKREKNEEVYPNLYFMYVYKHQVK